MKTHKTGLSVLLLSLFCATAFAQGEFFVEINKTSGGFTKVGPSIAGITITSSDDRAYDDSTGTFFFPSTQPARKLFSVKAADGSVLNSPVIGNISCFHFDRNLQKLFAIEQDMANNEKNLVEVNPATGTYIKLGNPIPGSAMNGANFSAYDHNNHNLFFLAPANKLYTIDVTTGNIVYSKTISWAPGESLINLVFDHANNNLHGLIKNSSQKFILVLINQSTGFYNKIGGGTTFGAANATAAIDKVTHEYVYMYSATMAGGYSVIAMAIGSGVVTGNVPVQAFTNSNNFSSLCYDRKQAKFYAIHWESGSSGTSVSEPGNGENGINIYPNPFSASATLHMNETPDHATLTLTNCLGQVVKQVTNISGKNISLSRDGLPSGTYLLRLTANNHILATKKLLITAQ